MSALANTSTAQNSLLEPYSFSKHYQLLYWALCRSKKNLGLTVQCCFCANKPSILINSFLRHYREHKDNKESCLVCGRSFFNRSLAYVYTHFSLCLTPENVPLPRAKLQVDVDYLKEYLRSSKLELHKRWLATLDQQKEGQAADLSALVHKVAKKRKRPQTLVNPVEAEIDTSSSKNDADEIEYRWEPISELAEQANSLSASRSMLQREAECPDNWCDISYSSLGGDDGSSSKQTMAILSRKFNRIRSILLKEREGGSGAAAADGDDGVVSQSFEEEEELSDTAVTDIPSTAINNDDGFFVSPFAIKHDADKLLLSYSPSESTADTVSSREMFFGRKNTMVISAPPPVYDDGSSSRNHGAMSCDTCDYQKTIRAEWMMDRWPDNEVCGVKLFEDKFHLPNKRLAKNFLPNDRFRLQYYNVPRWLSNQAPPQSLVEHMDFNATGVSTRMGALLSAAYRSETLILRHVYIYEFIALEALNVLLNSTDDFYVFPFSCLCSGNCFTETCRNEFLTALRNRTTDPLTRAVAAELMKKFPVDDEPKTGAAAAAKKPRRTRDTPKLTSKDVKMKKKRQHRSAEDNQRRQKFIADVLVYLQNTFDEQRGSFFKTVNCHRHLMVCVRDEKIWKRFTNRFCQRLLHTANTLSVDETSEFREAYQYLREHSFSTMFCNPLRNLPHVFNTISYICRPTHPFRGMNFRALRDLEVLALAWHDEERGCCEYDEDADDDLNDYERRCVREEAREKRQQRIVSLIVKKIVGLDRMFNNNHGNQCGADQGLQLLNRLGRFFLYDQHSYDRALSMEQRRQRYLRQIWQPKVWEDDHFYIATPFVEHALLMYWLIVDGCFVEQVNLLFTNWDFKSRFVDVAYLLIRLSTTQFCTRLGYLLPYFFRHYPLYHTLPLLNAHAVAERQPNSSMELRIRSGKRRDVATARVLGDLFDMLIPLSPAATTLFAKKMMQRNLLNVTTQ
jgi:hypothetical protein